MQWDLTRGALSLGQLALCINRSGAGVTVSHSSPLQDISSILPLVKKEPGRMRLNSDLEEVVEHT
jgi:hypothetical protein